jgi:hypothetical protein
MKLINTHVTKLQHNLTLIKKSSTLAIRGNAAMFSSDNLKTTRWRERKHSAFEKVWLPSMDTNTMQAFRSIGACM